MSDNTNEIDGHPLPDDILIVSYYHHRTVYIMAGEDFAYRVFGIHIDFDDPKYLYCNNDCAFHPNIEPQPKGYDFCCKIAKEDLDDISSDYNLVMSLRDLILHPKFSSPFNMDASLTYKKDPERFREFHRQQKEKEKTPFDNVEYTIKKVE